jgi:hypothetical protein
MLTLGKDMAHTTFYLLLATTNKATLLEKRLPAAHQNWLPVAHYQCAAGTTLLVFSYP